MTDVAELQDMDEGQVLGPEWGPLQGMTAEEALRIVANTYSQNVQETERLRQELQDLKNQSQGGGESGTASEPDLDMETLRNAEDDEAIAALERYTSQKVDQLVEKRLASREAETFEIDRERAKREAQANIGEDFNRFAAQLDKHMREPRVSKKMQKDPRVWEQAFTYLVGLEARSGRTSTQGDNVSSLSERPTYGQGNRRPTQEARVTDPDAKRAKAGFERVLGERIPDDEWLALENEIQTVDEYREFMRKKERQNKRGR